MAGVNVGQHTGIVEYPTGYDILMVTEEREAIITPFPEARDKVAKRMQADGQNRLRAAYVKELAKKTKVEIVQDELKEAFAKGIFP